MKNVILFVAVLLSLSFLRCTDESNPAGPNREPLDPITNTWRVENNPDYTFFFNTHDSTNIGIFIGTETTQPNDVESDIIGFFFDYYVEFNVLRDGIEPGLKFKGNFINSNRMEIESTEGKLVLIR